MHRELRLRLRCQPIANEAKWIKGNLVYAYAALRALVAWKPATFTLTIDGERKQATGFSVGACNSKAYGGGMYVAPDAEIDDGLLDIEASGDVGKLTFLRGLGKIFKGEHREILQVQTWRGTEVRIEADRPFAVYADGDHIADLPATVSLLPRALRVIVPAQFRPMSAAGFRAKVGIARATGALSRRSGRGGGTTLPGRLLLRIAPDAIARLGGALTGGSTIISATNGKTTTAGMLAVAMRAAGRNPVHNRAGSNMSWGVATALLEQRGKEGLFEVDEAWLPRIAAELDPGLIVLGNLFRDQLDRYGELEHLADEWAALVAERSGRCGFVLNADDPLVADLGRDKELRRRPDVTYFGIEDHKQALPELQHAHDAKHCRRCGHPYAYARAFVGHLGHYECPNCGADRPAPDLAATEIELLGMRGSRSLITTPEGRARLELPLPGLYNVYNALAAIAAALRLGIGLEQVIGALAGVEAAFGRVETIVVDERPVSILLIKNPAGAKRGPAHPAPGGRGRRSRPLGRAQRQNRRRPRCLLGVGRRLRAPRRGGPASLLLGHPGAGDGGAAQVRGCRARPAGGRALDRALAGQGGRRGRGNAVRASHLHGADRAPQAPQLTRPGEGVLGVSASPARLEAIWHDVECGAYGADLAVWRDLASSAAGPVLELGCGTGRVALDLAAAGHQVVALDLEPPLLAELGDRAAARGLDVETVLADARRLEDLDTPGRPFGAILAPMQLVHVVGGPGRPGGAARRRRRPARRRGHVRRRGPRRRRLRRRRSPRSAALARRPRVRRLGLLKPAGRHPRRRRRDRAPPRAPDRLAGRRAQRRAPLDPPRRAHRRAARGRGYGRGPRAPRTN